jgi:phosphate transport system substrate-binding protein
MMRIAIITLIIWLLGVTALWAEEKIVLGGSGGLTDEMSDLAKAYMAKNPSDKIEVLKETMGTSGGIGAVLNGRVTIGLVTHMPKGDHQSKLVYRVIARSPVGVAVHKSQPISSLTEIQICDIFSGKTHSWKEVGGGDGKISVLTRRQNDANAEAMREKVACFKDLKFTPEAIALSKGSEVLDGVNRRPGTIGIISATFNATDRGDIKTLAISGTPPTPEMVRSGKYRVYNERAVVTLGAPHGASKRFLDFVAGPEGQKILMQRDMIPVS